MKRNRIVINFDPKQSAAPGRSESRRGFLRPLLVIAVALLLLVCGLAAGGYFWWRHYQSSPAYSLALLADAAQSNDTATVDSMIDYDKIAEALAGQIGANTRLPFGAGSNWPLAGQLDSLGPSMRAKLKQTLQDETHKEVQRLTASAAGKPFPIIALAIPWYADIKQNDNAADARLNINQEQIQLTMQRADDHWKIVAFQDENLRKTLTGMVTRNLSNR